MPGAYASSEFCEEPFAADDVAHVGAFADDLVALHGDDVKGEATVFHLRQLSGGKHLRPYGRWFQVADVDVGAYGGLFLWQFLIYCQHGSVFHKGNHDGCCQYGHVARAHSLGSVSVADKEDAGVSKSDVHHFYYNLLNYC